MSKDGKSGSVAVKDALAELGESLAGSNLAGSVLAPTGQSEEVIASVSKAVGYSLALRITREDGTVEDHTFETHLVQFPKNKWVKGEGDKPGHWEEVAGEFGYAIQATDSKITVNLGGKLGYVLLDTLTGWKGGGQPASIQVRPLGAGKRQFTKRAVVFEV